MSNGITGYFVPNKIANSFVANKRTAEGELQYEGALQDVGVQTQAAIQALGKTYSSAVNDAYTNYLNSRTNIANSNLGQGYKEAYIQKQEEALQQNVAQATLTANETKQALLKQQYESQQEIGEAFQTEVRNLDRVDVELNNYLNYLKTVTKGGKSYYDQLAQGKEITAEDVYDALYNAAPLGYADEKGNAALNWEQYLGSNMRTEKDQAFYDWYMGEGGYELFKESYLPKLEAKLKAEQEAKLKAEQEAKLKAEQEAKLKAEQEYNTPIEISKSNFSTMQFKWRGEEYDGRYIGNNAKTATDITNKLNIRDKIKNGSVTYDSVIEYNGNYYIVKKSDTKMPSYIQLIKK